MIAKELEISLHDAFVAARSKGHKFIAVEHLLLAILRDSSAASGVVHACGVDAERLREDLARQVDDHAVVASAEEDPDTQPTMGFQRVIQRAILNVQARGGHEVTSADILAAVFAEKDERAVPLLTDAGLTADDVARHLGGAASDVAELQVVLYNDDRTPMQFVVDLLQAFFSMSKDDATEAMLEVHREGVAVCGLYARDDALDLVKRVLAHARRHGHPLRCAAVIPK